MVERMGSHALDFINPEKVEAENAKTPEINNLFNKDHYLRAKSIKNFISSSNFSQKIDTIAKLIRKEKSKKLKLELLNAIDENNISDEIIIKTISKLLKNKSGRIRAWALKYLHKHNIIDHEELLDVYIDNNKDTRTKAAALEIMGTTFPDRSYIKKRVIFNLEMDDSEYVKSAALKSLDKNFNEDGFKQIINLVKTTNNDKTKDKAIKTLARNTKLFMRTPSLIHEFKVVLMSLLKGSAENTEIKITALKELNNLMPYLTTEEDSIAIYTLNKLFLEISNDEENSMPLRKEAIKKIFFNDKKLLDLKEKGLSQKGLLNSKEKKLSQKKKNLSKRNTQTKWGEKSRQKSIPKRNTELQRYIETLEINEKNILSPQLNELLKINNSQNEERLFSIYKGTLKRISRINKIIDNLGIENVDQKLIDEAKNNNGLNARKKIVEYFIRNKSKDILNDITDPNTKIQKIVDDFIDNKNQGIQKIKPKLLKSLYRPEDWQEILNFLKDKDEKVQLKALKKLIWPYSNETNYKTIANALIKIYNESKSDNFKISILRELSNKTGEEINDLILKASESDNAKIKEFANGIVAFRLKKFLI